MTVIDDCPADLVRVLSAHGLTAEATGATLDKLGLAANTLVIVTSDHGDVLGATGLAIHHAPEGAVAGEPSFIEFAVPVPERTRDLNHARFGR